MMAFRQRLICLGLGLFLAGCGKEEDSGATVASIEHGSPPDSEVTYWLSDRLNLPDTPENRDRARRDLARRKALGETARRLGVDKDPHFRAMADDLLIARLMESHLQPRLDAVSVSDSDIRAHYEASIDQYRSPEQRRLAVLWFEDPRQEEQRTVLLDRLESARTRASSDPALKTPESGFGLLSVDFSGHRPTRFTGGILGWLPASPSDPWRKAVARIGFSLQRPGELSRVIESPEGLFLVRLIATRPARSQPLEAVAPAIHRQLLLRKKANLEETLLREWTSTTEKHER